jgi:cell division protein ZapA
VTILGQQYTLLSRSEPREVELLAQKVDELMASIAAKSSTADVTRVAVLACMHLADRLQNLEAEISRKSERMAVLLDEAIE